MPAGGPVVRPSDTVGTLWFGLAFEPAFGGLFVAITFSGESDGPAWQLWLLRAFIALFFCSVGTLTAIICFRAIRQRGGWLPPGVAKHPWLAPAGYVVLILVLSTAVLVGFITCVELLGRWSRGE